jgi:hypothetical protein
MNDFSDHRASAFEGLHEPQISTLLGILLESGIKNSDYIKRRYLERASRFDSTLHFLTEIGAVQNVNGELIINPSFQSLRDPITTENLTAIIIYRLVGRESLFRSELFDYVNRFRVLNGQVIYRPSVEQRSAESGVRNLLMELGVVRFDSSENQYVLMPENALLAAHARNVGLSVSPAEFRYSQRNKEELGFAAEQAIISYERNRIGPGLVDKINHVALRNIAAGYDIQSISVTESNRILPRYIEVKAVPAQTLRFYWTSNEIRVAEFFSSCYYLYLLPVDKIGDFDFERLRIIADPCSAVLRSSGEWIVEDGVLLCSLTSCVSET